MKEVGFFIREYCPECKERNKVVELDLIEWSPFGHCKVCPECKYEWEWKPQWRENEVDKV